MYRMYLNNKLVSLTVYKTYSEAYKVYKLLVLVGDDDPANYTLKRISDGLVFNLSIIGE